MLHIVLDFSLVAAMSKVSWILLCTFTWGAYCPEWGAVRSGPGQQGAHPVSLQGWPALAAGWGRSGWLWLCSGGGVNSEPLKKMEGKKKRLQVISKVQIMFGSALAVLDSLGLRAGREQC